MLAFECTEEVFLVGDDYFLIFGSATPSDPGEAVVQRLQIVPTLPEQTHRRVRMAFEEALIGGDEVNRFVRFSGFGVTAY